MSRKQGLLGIENTEYVEIPLSDSLAWFRARIGKFVKGGIYLIAGQPGIGKSTLGLQIALDIGSRGKKSIYIHTEQSKEEISQRARLMASGFKKEIAEKALESIEPVDKIYDIEILPQFLAREVLAPNGSYADVDFIVIDSIQGQGLSSAATSKYKKLYEFCQNCKSAGKTVLLVSHVTKRGDIAGPKDLEHNVDCVIVMRKAMIYRPMFVPKNRFGPAILRPIPLEMDKRLTSLKLAPHSEAVSTVAKTFLGGLDSSLPEVQAAVSLPNYGTRGKITAPGLPKKEIEQISLCISQIPNLDLEDLDFTINCRLPGELRYKRILGLPLAMALISSYIQKDVSPKNIYIGEVDLLRNVRDVPEDLIIELLQLLESNQELLPVRIYLPASSAQQIRGYKGISAISCNKLEDAVYGTWPELQEG